MTRRDELLLDVLTELARFAGNNRHLDKYLLSLQSHMDSVDNFDPFDHGPRCTVNPCNCKSQPASPTSGAGEACVFICPDCGPQAMADEDGCCIKCGRGCTTEVRHECETALCWDEKNCASRRVQPEPQRVSTDHAECDAAIAKLKSRVREVRLRLSHALSEIADLRRAAPDVTAAVEASDNATVTRTPGGRAVTCLAGYRAGDGPAYTCERSDARHVTHVDGRFAWTDADNRAAPPRSDDIRDIWVSDNGNLRRPNISELEEILAKTPAPAQPATVGELPRCIHGVHPLAPGWCEKCQSKLGATVGERKLAAGWQRTTEDDGSRECTHNGKRGLYDCDDTAAYYLYNTRDCPSEGACEAHAEEMGVFATPEAAPTATTEAPAGFRVVGRSGKDVPHRKDMWLTNENNVPPFRSDYVSFMWERGFYVILEPIATPPAPRLHHPACLNDKNHTGQCLPVSATPPVEPPRCHPECGGRYEPLIGGNEWFVQRWCTPECRASGRSLRPVTTKEGE